MDGNLWKWTNYFSGWQPRWFVLENGILSYYRSQEDVINGCKGSIKMSVCDVSVHATDNTRLDLIIPGEAHFYVKAATPQERQEWLIALGSCKAGQPLGTIHSVPPSVSTSELQEDQLKSKKSELRLYCDLLMQQVHSVKTSVKEKESPDIQQLNEATSLLSATCDTFINTLDECVTLVNNAIPLTPTSSGHSPGIREGVGPPTPTKNAFSRISPYKSYQGSNSRSLSSDSANAYMSGDEDGIVRGFIPPQFRNQRNPLKSNNRSRNSSESSSGGNNSGASPNNSPSHSKSSIGLIVENGEIPNNSYKEASLSEVNGKVSTSYTDTLSLHIPNGDSDNSNSHSNQSQTKSHSLPVTPTLSHSTSLEDDTKQQKYGHTSLDSNVQYKSSNSSMEGKPSHFSTNIMQSSSDDVFDENGTSGKYFTPENAVNGSVQILPSQTVRKLAYPEDGVRDPIQTFFSTMEISFQDIKLFEDGGIATTQFLSSCKEVLPIFDKLNPTAFAPIKMEFTGNVRKIHQKYSTDPDQFITLQNIVLFEMKKGQHSNANSATVALLWLKRGLEFIREFLLEYMTGIQDLTKASNNAYSRSLKPFHSYVVRGVFALAAKSAPTREVFTESLAKNSFHTKRANFEQILLRDIEAYVTANDVTLKILNDFYAEYDLHSTQQM